MGGEIVGSRTNRLTGNPNPFSSARPSFPVSSFLSPNPSSSSNFGRPLFATSANRLPHGARDEIETETLNGSLLDSVFWSVPTRIEVENAIAALQSFMQGLSSSRPAADQLQPILSHVDPRILQSPGFQRVCDAFHLLQTVPSVQRMVMSISSDRAVWDAVLSNNQVQEFQQSLRQARLSRPQGLNEGELDLVSMILRWILDNMKLKVVELIDVLKSLVNNSSGSPRKQNNNPGLKHQFEEMICSTVLLSIITLLIVLVTRAKGS